jgi:hypothetical protein
VDGDRRDREPSGAIPFDVRAEAFADENESSLPGTRRGVDANRVLMAAFVHGHRWFDRQGRSVGDRRWRELLDQYEAMGAELERFRGRLIKSTGDGALATFDGPARAICWACTLATPLEHHHVVAVFQGLDGREREADLRVEPADNQSLTPSRLHRFAERLVLERVHRRPVDRLDPVELGQDRRKRRPVAAGADTTVVSTIGSRT